LATTDEVLRAANSDDGEAALGDGVRSVWPQPSVAQPRQATKNTGLCRATMARNKALSAARRKCAGGITSART
jgi:hypothetical protein